MKIWVDENIPMGKEAFAAHGEVISFAGRGLQRKDILTTDALIVRSVTRVDKNLLEGTPVKFVGTATIGTDHVDREYLKESGIGFSAAPGCNANSVGEYVVTALTYLEMEKGFSLKDRTLGIIGFGHVGKRVAQKAAALEIRVLKNDPPLAETERGADAKPDEFTGLDTLLQQSDIISLHVPLTLGGKYPTKHLANANFFSKLTRPVVLFNTCRGEVIDEHALKIARENGLIRNLVLDVFQGEPSIDQNICNLADLVSPHIAGYSLQGKLNGTKQIADAFRRHFRFTTEWEPQISVPATPEINYQDLGSDEAFRYLCVHTAYNMLGDDARLRNSFTHENPSQAFDRLRRDYPIRHEFISFRILGVPERKRELRSQLAELGFQVV